MTDEGELSDQELDDLVALQGADTLLRRIRYQLGHLSEQQALDAARSAAEGLGDQVASLRVDRDQGATRQRQLEADTDLLRQRLVDEQQRLYGGEITSPKELQSQRAAIDSTQRRVTEHEDDLLEVMEKLERLEATLAGLEERQSVQIDSVAEAEKLRDEAAQHLLAAEAETAVDRDRLRAALPVNLVERYDAVAERNGGVAVGELIDGTCTACRLELARIDLNELVGGPSLGTCPECRRMLVVRD